MKIYLVRLSGLEKLTFCTIKTQLKAVEGQNTKNQQAHSSLIRNNKKSNKINLSKLCHKHLRNVPDGTNQSSLSD